MRSSCSRERPSSRSATGCTGSVPECSLRRRRALVTASGRPETRSCSTCTRRTSVSPAVCAATSLERPVLGMGTDRSARQQDAADRVDVEGELAHVERGRLWELLELEEDLADPLRDLDLLLGQTCDVHRCQLDHSRSSLREPAPAFLIPEDDDVLAGLEDDLEVAAAHRLLRPPAVDDTPLLSHDRDRLAVDE